jgi:LuxR family quorum sensing-dependent transcriptional regulator
MQQLGATYLQTRIYLRPEGPLTSDKHFSAGGVIQRIAPDAWARQRCVRFCLLPLQSAA